MTAPIASGWSESPGGPCTHWKAPPFHGARRQRPLRSARSNGGSTRSSAPHLGVRDRRASSLVLPKLYGEQPANPYGMEDAAMIDHTGIGVADVARSAAFYDA